MMIDALGEVGMRLCEIHGGVCRGVEDDVGFHARKSRTHLRVVADIEAFDGERDGFMLASGKQQLFGQLPAPASDQCTHHANDSAHSKFAPLVRSFSESCTNEAPPISSNGQGTATVGSFHASVRSLAGS